MKKRFKRLQNDLRNGMTIEDALTKHNMTFKEAFENMERPHVAGGKTVAQMKTRTRKAKTGQKYITKIKKRYCIYKNRSYFGSYSSLRDAVKIRDYCNQHGWFIEKLDQYCKECNVERCTK